MYNSKLETSWRTSRAIVPRGVHPELCQIRLSSKSVNTVITLRVLRSATGRSSIRLGSSSALGSNNIGVGRLGRGAGVQVALILVNSPVENIVILESLADEEITEDLAEIAIVGLIVESERSSVVEVNGELVGEAAAKDFGRGGHLLLHDSVVLLLLGSSLQTLPRERATTEVEHDVAKRFHIITARLFNAEVSVDRGISSSAGKVLVLAVRDMK